MVGKKRGEDRRVPLHRMSSKKNDRWMLMRRSSMPVCFFTHIVSYTGWPQGSHQWLHHSMSPSADYNGLRGSNSFVDKSRNLCRSVLKKITRFSGGHQHHGYVYIINVNPTTQSDNLSPVFSEGVSDHHQRCEDIPNGSWWTHYPISGVVPSEDHDRLPA